MIKVDNIETWGFEHAIRGMRNPMNSWNKMDSYSYTPTLGVYSGEEQYQIGENDLTLMKKLFKAGTEHRKYARQIFVSMDITAPLYWWKEFDTYKVGTVANSCSTMHKLTEKEFTFDDFSFEKVIEEIVEENSFGDYVSYPVKRWWQETINRLNFLRQHYLKTKDKDIWYSIIQLIPSSYNQKRTVTMTYENVFAMIHQRKGHKLDEWNEFVKMLQNLPYVTEISGGE